MFLLNIELPNSLPEIHTSYDHGSLAANRLDILHASLR